MLNLKAVGAKNQIASSKKDKTAKEFHNLPPRLKKQLDELYEMDFKIFGYSNKTII